MNSKFTEKHTILLKTIDPEIANFYRGWLCLQESNNFEAIVNLLAHLARETLEGLRKVALEKKKVPKHIERTWKDIVLRLDKFRHRHKLWNAPHKNEDFNEVWFKFETLLVYIIESDFDFHDTADNNIFIDLQDALVRLQTKLDKAPVSEWTIPNIELSASQSEINQNLQTLAPLLASFYRDWLRIRQSNNFNCRSYFLGHLAREIASGFRDILSLEEDEDQIKESLKNEDLRDLKEHKAHIASIMSALGIPDFDLRAEQWINISKDFATLAHKDRNEHEKSIRRKSEPLWTKFEELLAFLVGEYLNLLDRVDKIRNTEQPNENMVRTLHKLLEVETLYKHFFSNLKSSVWLKPLKEGGWFNPEKNPMPQEYPDQPGYYYMPRWYALEYVVKISTHKERSVDILVDIVNDIVKSAGDHRNRINNKWTDWQTIKIIGALPPDRIKYQHITFMGTALKFKSKSGLVDQEISQVILPKLLNVGAKELTLILLKVIFDSKVVEEECDPEITEAAKESTLDLLRVMFGSESVNHEIIADIETYEPKGVNREITYMQEYWLRDTLKEHGESIVKLCGLKAANIAIEQIRILIAEGVTSFDRIQLVGTKPSDAPHENYAELLVGFVSRILRFADSISITDMLEDLLQVPQTIIRRIALSAVTHHYSDLKQMFWEWKGNPLEEVGLQRELYQLIQTNCTEFKDSEIEQILEWIKLAQYTTVFAKDDEARSKAAAYRKREWLSALLETGNEKVIAADQKYEQINPKPIEHPGFLRRTESWWGETSPMMVKDLLRMSNEQIAKYLNDFEEIEVFRRSDPTERGLAQTLEKCVETNPQKFTDNLLPFQAIRNLYQSSLLHGFLTVWREKKQFDWSALLEFIHQILLSEQFWSEQYEDGLNCRNWALAAAANLISDGTKNDKHAFDAQLLPIAEEILLLLAEKTEPSMFTLIDSSLDAFSSNRGKTFSAMIDYALRFARANENELENYRWPQAIRADFTKRLDRSVEPSLEFSYTLGFHLPYLSYLDKEWVHFNINRIFPQRNEDHWQAAFSGYLLRPGVCEEFYVLLKAHGHYRKALSTRFADAEVLDGLVRHICTGWIEGSEVLNDKTSLIYQLIHSGNPNLLIGMVYFFSRQSDDLSDKVKTKVRPAWKALFEVLSPHSNVVEYQKILSLLSGWIGLIDEIDTEVLEWVKTSIKYIDKRPRYALTLSNIIKTLQKHALIRPEKVGEIYLGIPESELWSLGQTQRNEVEETIRILYQKGYKGIADEICNRFGKAGTDSIRPIYKEYQC